VGYVLTIACSHQVGTALGIRRAVDLAVGPDLTWHRVSAGPGAHGHRCYDWALIGLHLTDSDYDRHGGHHALLVRRHRRTGEMAFYRTWTPTPVPLSVLSTVAGRRWTIEEAFQAGKGLAALDEHQVRRWTSRRRWTVLAMLAHAFLAVTAATSTGSTTSTHLNATLIRLTCGETRRLLQALTAPPTPTISPALHWSHWRRRTQARACASHYQRQTLTE
jgi:hypothetical protein